MAHTSYDKYLETEVLTADPLKLVNMLYRAAIEAVEAARRHLASGEIRERSRKITKAWEIVHELRRSLDDQHGVDLTRQLRGLYAYVQGRLLEANAQQADAPLAEAERILKTLLEGWSAAHAAAAAAVEQDEPVICLP